MNKKQIIYRAKRLKYFDSNLHKDIEKIQAISKEDIRNQDKFHRELQLVRKLLTIHAYLICKEDTEEGIMANKIPLTKSQFKNFCTSPYLKEAAEKNDGRVIIAGILEAQWMTSEEFDVMVEVYQELL